MNDKNNNHPRILAIDPRSRRFGFAILEGHRELLEWGVKNYRVSADNVGLVVQKRIAPLFSLFAPEVIVLRHIARSAHDESSLHKFVMNVIEDEARRHTAELVTVGRDELHRTFGNAVTKCQIASQVALLFPELTWTLPPVRKSWMSEHHSMTIFGAVALGLAYFGRFGNIYLNDADRPHTSKPG